MATRLAPASGMPEIFTQRCEIDVRHAEDGAVCRTEGYLPKGYPAVMLTETAFYRNPQYHRSTDRPETLDYRAMAAPVQGTPGVLVTLDRIEENQLASAEWPHHGSHKHREQPM